MFKVGDIVHRRNGPCKHLKAIVINPRVSFVCSINIAGLMKIKYEDDKFTTYIYPREEFKKVKKEFANG